MNDILPLLTVFLSGLFGLLVAIVTPRYRTIASCGLIKIKERDTISHQQG